MNSVSYWLFKIKISRIISTSQERGSNSAEGANSHKRSGKCTVIIQLEPTGERNNVSTEGASSDCCLNSQVTRTEGEAYTHGGCCAFLYLYCGHYRRSYVWGISGRSSKHGYVWGRINCFFNCVRRWNDTRYYFG